jgi:hypothetical protein
MFAIPWVPHEEIKRDKQVSIPPWHLSGHQSWRRRQSGTESPPARTAPAQPLPVLLRANVMGLDNQWPWGDFRQICYL